MRAVGSGAVSVATSAFEHHGQVAGDWVVSRPKRCPTTVRLLDGQPYGPKPELVIPNGQIAQLRGHWAVLRGLSPHDQLTPLRAVVRCQEMKDHLAILDQYAVALPCPAEREVARRAAGEVRADQDRAPVPAACPGPGRWKRRSRCTP